MGSREMNKRSVLRTGIMKVIFVLIVAISFFLQPYAAIRAGAGEGYHIYINVVANVVTVYYDGDPVRTMITSTGTATPLSGTYNTSQKFDWGYLNGNVYGQYCTRIYKGILFHSVPYTKAYNYGSLKHGQFDLLGTPASMGCMRLCVGDAKWIYDNIPSNTPVTFYSDEQNPGPLGMPYSAKIDDFGEAFSGWDPTDLNPANPWKAFLGSCFNADYYLEHNPDLKGMAPWTDVSLKLHWLTCGIKEGRCASSIFNIEAYKKQLNYRFGNNNYAYVAYYNTWGFLGASDVQIASRVTLTLPKGYEYVNKVDKPAATPTPIPTATPTPDPDEEETGEEDMIVITPTPVADVDKGTFNAVAYADRYPDLKAVYGYDPIALWNHYNTIGRYEGRVAD